MGPDRSATVQTVTAILAASDRPNKYGILNLPMTKRESSFRRFPARRLLARRALFGAAVATLCIQPIVAQTAPETISANGLNIPTNAQLFGNTQSNVYRPSATVNGEIITATDVEQRIALLRLANNGVIPEEQMAQLRLQVFGQLIDEMLQIQEAKAQKIEPTDNDINQEFARVAAQLRQSPEQFAQFLSSQGSSVASMRQQLRASLSWQNVLGRNIDPFTNVSEEEVKAMLERMQSARGTEEVRLAEIYLPATAANMESVVQAGRAIMEQMARGEMTFSQAAQRFSQSSTKSSGGDLGWVRPNQLPTTLAQAAQGMESGQLVGPVESPGGVSILYMVDKRRVLTADTRDAVLSLKQISLAFPAGTSEPQAQQLASNFATRTRAIAGCGAADSVAEQLGAQIVSSDRVSLRDLPAPLQAALSQMQIGQVTQMFGSPDTGVSVLVLCGRDVPPEAAAPSVEVVANRMRQERIERRAERYMRDLRRDAVIDYARG